MNVSLALLRNVSTVQMNALLSQRDVCMYLQLRTKTGCLVLLHKMHF